MTWETTSCGRAGGRLHPVEQRHLVGQRHGDGIDLEGAGPGDLAVGGLGGQLDAPAAGPGRDPGGVDGLADQVGRRVGPHIDGGGEPDGAVDHDPHAHAELGVVRGALGRRRRAGGRDWERMRSTRSSAVGAAGGGGGRERGVGQARRGRRGGGAPRSGTSGGGRLAQREAGGDIDGVDELHGPDGVDGGGGERGARRSTAATKASSW